MNPGSHRPRLGGIHIAEPTLALYRTLLHAGPLTVRQIAERHRRQRNAVRRSMRHLRHAGLVDAERTARQGAGAPAAVWFAIPSGR